MSVHSTDLSICRRKTEERQANAIVLQVCNCMRQRVYGNRTEELKTGDLPPLYGRMRPLRVRFCHFIFGLTLSYGLTALSPEVLTPPTLLLALRNVWLSSTTSRVV